jgi:hypothetical protein
MKKLLRAVHWDQVLLYFVAFWLFSHAFQVLACLLDTDTAESVRLAEDTRFSPIVRHSQSEDPHALNRIMTIGRVVGAIVGFLYTIYLARKRGGNWINPTVAFLLTLVLGFFHLLGWAFVKNIFLSPGSLLNGAMYYVVDGLILLLLGGGIIYFNHRMRKKKNQPEEDIEFA